MGTLVYGECVVFCLFLFFFVSVFFFFNDTATTEIYTFPTRRSSDLLEMQKLAAESRLQQSQLLEYSVAEEQYAREKARLEEEVKLLMSRVQEMDSARQNKDLDASSRISELEGKVSLLFTAIILTSQLTTGKKAKNVKQDSRIQKVYSNQYKYQTSNGTAESNSVQLSLST